MRLVIIIPLLAACIASTTAQNYAMDTTSPNPPDQTMASRISAIIVETISRAFAYFFELLDIKVRSVRFLSSLYTTDNLVLFKKVLNLGLRFGNWLYGAIPDSTTEGQNQLLSLLFPQVNLENESEYTSQPNDLGLNSSPSQKEPSTESTRSHGDHDGLEENELYDNYNDVMNLRRLIHGGY